MKPLSSVVRSVSIKIVGLAQAGRENARGRHRCGGFVAQQRKHVIRADREDIGVRDRLRTRSAGQTIARGKLAEDVARAEAGQRRVRAIGAPQVDAQRTGHDDVERRAGLAVADDGVTCAYRLSAGSVRQCGKPCRIERCANGCAAQERADGVQRIIPWRRDRLMVMGVSYTTGLLSGRL